MNKNKVKWILLSLFVVILIVIDLSVVKNEDKEIDENMLYSQSFGKTMLKFERYDYVLGQRMLVGVEKSVDKGKTYQKVTKDVITVSNEARFAFLNPSLAFAISTGYIEKDHDYQGFLVSKDGGKTFQNAKFTYENNRVNQISIDEVPYCDENSLKLNCSIYDIKKDGTGYEEVELVFTSYDDGLSWSIE